MNTTDTVELRTEERTRCEVWTRVMGYHRPVSAFNLGKQAEHAERSYFVEHPRQGHPQPKPGHPVSAREAQPFPCRHGAAA
jgi:hypothetical protein